MGKQIGLDEVMEAAEGCRAHGVHEGENLDQAAGQVSLHLTPECSDEVGQGELVDLSGAIFGQDGA